MIGPRLQIQSAVTAAVVVIDFGRSHHYRAASLAFTVDNGRKGYWRRRICLGPMEKQPGAHLVR